MTNKKRTPRETPCTCGHHFGDKWSAGGGWQCVKCGSYLDTKGRT